MYTMQDCDDGGKRLNFIGICTICIHPHRCIYVTPSTVPNTIEQLDGATRNDMCRLSEWAWAHGRCHTYSQIVFTKVMEVLGCTRACLASLGPSLTHAHMWCTVF